MSETTFHKNKEARSEKLYDEMNATEFVRIDFMFLEPQQSFWIRYCSTKSVAN